MRTVVGGGRRRRTAGRGRSETSGFTREGGREQNGNPVTVLAWGGRMEWEVATVERRDGVGIISGIRRGERNFRRARFRNFCKRGERRVGR